eukprot:g6357.t1
MAAAAGGPRTDVLRRKSSSAGAFSSGDDSQDDGEDVDLLGGGGDGGGAGALRARVSVCRMLGISSFMLANGLLLTTYAMVTLGVEAQRFALALPAGSASDTMLLTLFLALAGITQLVCPLVGFLSDRLVTPWGKRRPFIFCGFVLGCIGLTCQRWARDNIDAHPQYSLNVYIVWFFISMVALNMIYSPASGLVPDIVPPQQTGMANGVITLLQVAGACGGFGFYFISGDPSQLYGLYIGVVTVTSCITLVAAGGAAN